MVDNDHVGRGLRWSHLQPELLLHRGVKIRWRLRIIGRRRYSDARSSESSELGFIWSPFQLEVIFALQFGLVHHRLVQNRLHPTGKVRHALVSHGEIPKPSKEEGRIIIGSRRTLGN